MPSVPRAACGARVPRRVSTRSEAWRRGESRPRNRRGGGYCRPLRGSVGCGLLRTREPGETPLTSRRSRTMGHARSGRLPHKGEKSSGVVNHLRRHGIKRPSSPILLVHGTAAHGVGARCGGASATEAHKGAGQRRPAPFSLARPSSRCGAGRARRRSSASARRRRSARGGAGPGADRCRGDRGSAQA